MICLEFGDIGLLFGSKKLAFQPGSLLSHLPRKRLAFKPHRFTAIRTILIPGNIKKRTLAAQWPLLICLLHLTPPCDNGVLHDSSYFLPQALQPGDGPQSFYFKILAGISSATLETIYIYYDKRGTTYASITE